MRKSLWAIVLVGTLLAGGSDPELINRILRAYAGAWGADPGTLLLLSTNH